MEKVHIQAAKFIFYRRAFMTKIDNPKVLSPLATGGAGGNFEQQCGIYFLSLLLINGMPPVISECGLDEVTLQAGWLGWRTDDILLKGLAPSGKHQFLAIQVKRQFTVSVSNEECRKTIIRFWQDF